MYGPSQPERIPPEPQHRTGKLPEAAAMVDEEDSDTEALYDEYCARYENRRQQEHIAGLRSQAKRKEGKRRRDEKKKEQKARSSKKRK